MTITKGAIAAGHPETAETAELILREGGNAFDAVVAAQLTACVVEPVLTSLGGGGFLLAKTESGAPVLYDFFVQTPLQKRDVSEIQFYPIKADFGTVQQEFHIGAGSIAAPGTVKGLFTIHKDLCSMPFKRLAEPAIDLARQGIAMNSFQSYVLDVVKPIYLSTAEAIQTFGSKQSGRQLTTEGDLLEQPVLADVLDQLVQEGDDIFYRGDIARSISNICSQQGGHLTDDDLKNYRVYKRKPLRIPYRNAVISINPPPSSGGILVGFALKLMESVNPAQMGFGSVDYLDLLAKVQGHTNKARIDAFGKSSTGQPESEILDSQYLEQYKNVITDRQLSSRGTTHISIIDNKGNMASLTSSNGEGSGLMIPGTGIMLNNMLGEEDLNPNGFHSWITGQRMTSMMAPGIASLNNKTKDIVFGSGGSNRIRTAILQLLINLIDFDMTLEQAISAPRIHFEKGLLNVENGFESSELNRLPKLYPNYKIWNEKSLFFGGTHAVQINQNGFTGFGDPRRDGVSIILDE
jgi:gamma-glutamyltranspeptidase / glutathione hydrolase